MQDSCMENISQVCISLLPAITMEHLWLLNLTKKRKLSGLFQSQGNKCNHIFLSSQGDDRYQMVRDRKDMWMNLLWFSSYRGSGIQTWIYSDGLI